MKDHKDNKDNELEKDYYDIGSHASYHRSMGCVEA